MKDENKIVLVIGGSGMLGTEICKQIKERGWIFESPSPKELNICDREGVLGWFENYAKNGIGVPYAVVNCAAMSNVDICENLPGDAFNANCIGAKNVADACIKHKVPLLVHVSTDYVFDSPVPDRMHSGTDTTFFPANTYGVSKLAGEIAIRSAYHRSFCEYDGEGTIPDYIIARTSRLYGTGRRNYVDFVCDLCLSDVNGMEPPKSPQPIDDGNRTIPTSAKDAATIILSAIDGFDTDYSNAVINAVDGLGFDSAAPSLYEYTEAIYSILEEIGKKPYRWFTKKANRNVEKSSAMRPSNSTLVPPPLMAPYKPIPYWKDSLKEYIKEKYQ